MFKLDLGKAGEPEIKLPTSIGSQKKQGNSRKKSTSASLTTLMPVTVSITTNCGKFLKRWEYQTTLPASWEDLYAGQEAKVRTGHGTTDWFKMRKGVCHSCILSPCLFSRVQDAGWMKHKLESRLLGEISITSDMQMTPPYSRNWGGTEQPLDEGEGGEWKSWLKTQHSEN